jgi:hypothetical protein
MMRNKTQFTNFWGAQTFLGNKSSRNIPSIRGTEVKVRGEGCIGLYYWNSLIVEYFVGGVVKVYPCYESVTTKRRINTFSPVSCCQKNWQWYINGEKVNTSSVYVWGAE